MFNELEPDWVLVLSNPDSEVGHFGELSGNAALKRGLFVAPDAGASAIRRREP